jgi:hypothetical protein
VAGFGFIVGSRPVINSCVLFTWTEILPAAIRSLPPFHQQIVRHIMELPATGSEATHMQYERGTWIMTASTGSLDVRLPPSVYTFRATASPAPPIWSRDMRREPHCAGISAKGTPGYASPGLYGRMDPAMRISAGGGNGIAQSTVVCVDGRTKWGCPSMCTSPLRGSGPTPQSHRNRRHGPYTAGSPA